MVWLEVLPSLHGRQKTEVLVRVSGTSVGGSRVRAPPREAPRTTGPGSRTVQHLPAAVQWESDYDPGLRPTTSSDCPVLKFRETE